MNAIRKLALTALMACSFVTAIDTTSQNADAGYRHYYSNWQYNHGYGYHYRTYYYKPIATYTRYHYHYCIHYPRSRYVYFYNPIRRVFWGRFDTQGKDGAQYSLLAPKDQNSELKAIPESAFPAPGPMPAIPNSDDGQQIEAITDLPTTAPADLPTSK